MIGNSVGFLLTFMIVLAGCDPGSSGTAARVASGQWPSGMAWHLSEKPVVRIGNSENLKYIFHDIRGLMRLNDGRIAVADGGTQELRFFDGSGVYLESFGGRGAGPGEFQGLTWIRQLGGDSIAAYDIVLRRMTVISPGGETARVFRFESSSEYLLLFPQFIFTGGSFFVQAGPPTITTTDAGQPWTELSFLRFSPEGKLINVIGSFLARSCESAVLPCRHPIHGTRAQWFVRDNRLFYTRADRWRVVEYNMAGQMIGTFQRPWRPGAVSDSAVASYRDAWLEAADNPDDRRRIERELATSEFADTYPAISELLVDGEGMIWLKAYNSRDWSVFNSEYEHLGNVRLPADFEVHEIGADYVLGIHEDSIGLEYVWMYELRKPGMVSTP